MRFQSKWANARYIVRPTTFTIYPGIGKQKHPGLMVRFTGPQRIFDLDRVSAQERWTDEEKQWVKQHLLGHPDFGNGLYLAPDQMIAELPEEDRALIKNDVPIPTKKCAFIDMTGDSFVQCPESASLGSEFCPVHDPASPNNIISRGMGATVREAEAREVDGGN